MATVESNGLKLHYETIGSGPAVVLQHGFSSSLERWHLSGVVDALRDQYQLVLLDARGHGKSDKPHSPSDYSWGKRASDIVSVVDHIGIDEFTLWGYSMGGMYAYWVNYYYPERINGLIIGGIDPYGIEKEKKVRNTDGSNPELFIEQFEKRLGAVFSPDAKARILENDLHALAAAMNATLDSEVPLSDLPKNISTRCLVYCAVNDRHFSGAKASSAEISTSTFVALPNMDHLMAAFNNEMILPYIVEFLSEQ